MAKPWEKAAGPQTAPQPKKPWEKAAISSQPPAVAAPIDRPAPFSSPNPMAIAMENAQRLTAGATMPARARQDGWKPDQWAAAQRGQRGSQDLNDRMALKSWESYNRELPKSSTPPMPRKGLMFEAQRKHEAEDAARYQIDNQNNPQAPTRQATPDINLPPGHAFVRDNDKVLLRDPTGGTWAEEYWPQIIERGEASDWQDYYRREAANTAEVQRDKSGFEQTMSDIGRGLGATIQKNENARTVVGAPIQFGQGLGDAVRNTTNNGLAIGTDAVNAVRGLADPNAVPFAAPRTGFMKSNALVDPGGALASDAGVIPRMAGQVVGPRVLIGQGSPLGGYGNMAAKDALALAITSDPTMGRMSDLIPSNTPGIGAVADVFRSNENDSTLASMTKTLGEDLLTSALGYGAAKVVGTTIGAVRPRAPKGSYAAHPDLDPATAAQMRRVVASPDAPPTPPDVAASPPYPRPDMAPEQPQPAQAAQPRSAPSVAPFSQPPAPKGGVLGRNADRIVGGAVGGFLGGGGDALAAPGDGSDGGDGSGIPYGAASGAAIGIFGPRAVASVGGRAWRSAARPFGGAGFDEHVAARAFRKALASGGITSVEEGLAAQPARFGGKPAPAYGFSQQATNLTAGLARLPGETPDAARAHYESLIEERAARLERDLQQATGLSPATVTGDIKRLEQEAQAVAHPEYDALRSKYTTLTSDRLTKMTEESPTLAASVRAVEAHKAERLATKGDGMSDFEKWDLVKRDLDHKEQALIEQGVSLADLRIQNLDNARTELVTEMDRLIPNDEYAKARQLGGEAPRIRQAFAEGKGYIGGRNTPEEVLAMVSEWTGASLTAAQSGALRTIMGKTDGAGAAIASLRTPKAKKQIAAVFGQEAAANIDRRLAADAALVQNASRVNPNVGSATSQAGMGGGEGPLAVAANLFRAGTNPFQTALAAMSKSGAYTQAQRDLMGQMALDGMTRENLERIFRGQRPRTPPTPRPPRPAPAAPPTSPPPRRPLPGETSSASPTVTGALVGGGLAYAGSDGDPTATVAGALGGGLAGYGAGRFSNRGAKPPKGPPKPVVGVPKAAVAFKRDPALSSLSPGDMVAYIGAKYPPAGPNLPPPYYTAASAIKRANGDRVAATKELADYAAYLKQSKSAPEVIENAERTVRAVADVDPIFFDDAAFNASMKGRVEAGGTAAMEKIRGATADDGIGATFDPSQSGSSKLLAGMGGTTGAGAAGGGILGGVFARDANGDGVVDAQERTNGALGGMVSGGIVGKYGPGIARAAKGTIPAVNAGALKGPANKLAKGPPRPRIRAPDQSTFGGVNAKTADRAALGRAQNMEAEGASREEIIDATGWFKQHGDWKFEIDDSGARVKRGVTDKYLTMKPGDATRKPLAEVMDHPELYEAYPDLATRNTDVGRLSRGAFGEYDYGKDTFGMYSADPSMIRSGLLHEAGGHGVQAREGFAAGGSPENMLMDELKAINDEMSKLARQMDVLQKNKYYSGRPPKEVDAEVAALKQQYDDLMDRRSAEISPAAQRDAYNRLAGEAEARNVQTRDAMRTRGEKPGRPWETQDVPDDRQIVRFRAEGGKAESRPKPPPAKGPPKPRSVEGMGLSNDQKKAIIGAMRPQGSSIYSSANPKKLVNSLIVAGRLPEAARSDAIDFVITTRTKHDDRWKTRPRQGADPLEIAGSNRDWRLENYKKQLAADAALDAPIASAWREDFRKRFKVASAVDARYAEAEAMRATVEAISRNARKRGYSIRHVSSGRDGRNTSQYIVIPQERGGGQIRVSNHELPETDARFFAAMEGRGPRWKGDIVVSDWRKSSIDDYLRRIEEIIGFNSLSKSLPAPALKSGGGSIPPVQNGFFGGAKPAPKPVGPPKPKPVEARRETPRGNKPIQFNAIPTIVGVGGLGLGAAALSSQPAEAQQIQRVPKAEVDKMRSEWDKRADGSAKGDGWLGVLKRPDGGVSSEISVGLDFGGKEVELPVLVPTLSPDQVNAILRMDPEDPQFWDNLPADVRKKAIAHAQQRMSQGKSPFAGPNETPYATAGRSH